MADDVQTMNGTSVTSLVSGIVDDAQRLLTQQLKLFQAEIKQDMKRTREASLLLATGLCISLLGGIVLVFALAHLLNWAFPTALPLWVCYGLTGLVVAVVGGAVAYTGKKQFDSFNPLPDESLQALQENVQWLTKAPK
jgi:hypothetical protein